MKPRLTPTFALINLTLSLTSVAVMLNWAFGFGLAAGLIAILCSSPLFVLVYAALNSQFDTTSQDEETARGRYSRSDDDACTNQTKEDESN